MAISSGTAPTSPTRLVAWNVLQGGNPRIPTLLDAIGELDPQVVVLSEVKAATLEHWRRGLADLGLVHLTEATGLLTPTDPYAVVIASATRHSPRIWQTPGPNPNRAIRVQLDHLTVTAIHAPYQDLPGRNFYEWLRQATHDDLQRDAVIIGDFNTDQDGLRLSPYLAPMISDGWGHALRLHHPEGDHASWWSWAGAPFAIDHCLLSPSIAQRLHSASLLSEIGGTPTAGPGLRIADGALSDHRPLVVELA